MKPYKHTESIAAKIFSVGSDVDFEDLAMDVFRFQYAHNAVYRKFCDVLGRMPGSVHALNDIPFLPVEMFRQHRVVSFSGRAQKVFSSSGTTGQGLSKHHVKEMSLYKESYLRTFNLFYGDLKRYCVLALLPSYLEREGSSLVYMARGLIAGSGHPDSGFYLYNTEALVQTLRRLTGSRKGGDSVQVLLLGVSFALLDLAEQHPMKMKNVILMETGGMKGRRMELTRQELHERLKKAFGIEAIHSEYGMTELLSQAYSRGEGLFACPPWMRVLIRDSNDPLTITNGKRAGGINVIDLANLYSCSFLATHDLGKMHSHGLFEVLGRFDNSDIRGCNLMVG